MRIDAREPEFRAPWHVWDAERCCELRKVVWVDDVMHEYGVYADPFHLDDIGQASTTAIKVREIRIHFERRLVVINPAPDAELEAHRHDAVSA